MRHSNDARRRPGFTLIELLVVIVILAVLIGLLLPAIMRAVGTARDAAVAAEINAMAQALADFKNRYGEYPPSRIVLCENGNYSTTANPGLTGVLALLVPRSVAAFRKYWPRVQISTQGQPPVISTTTAPLFFYDFNGNGTYDQTPYEISGAECLVFFLGGIPQTTSVGSYAATGFSRNPTNPFQNAATSSNRLPPLFEFKSDRLGDFDGNFMPEYRDSLGGDQTQGIYYYYSAYGGVGYDPNDDMNSTATPWKEPDDANPATIPSIHAGFMTSNSPDGTVNTTRTDFISSTAPNPYVNNDYAIPQSTPGPSGAADLTNHNPRPWMNPQSFQIISPGRDRLYGPGGGYFPQAPERLPFSQAANNTVTLQTLSTDVRTRERDNLTNFAPGGLE